MTDKTALKLWLHLAKTSALLQNEITGRFRAHYGQSLARFDVLSQLARAETQTLSIRALSASLIASSGNITRLLDRMQAEGLLSRSPAPHDRRSTLVCLTSAGASLFEGMAKDHEIWVGEMLANMPQSTQQELLDGLLRLQNNFVK
ncbi:MAG: MarR family transcriptional regulator [Robiginitomaculum sp.]|nr:MAG: MarR family transcriptional regulator [Robiginitomaculum sp.]